MIDYGVRLVFTLLMVLILIACTGTVAFADAAGAAGTEEAVSAGMQIGRAHV